MEGRAFGTAPRASRLDSSKVDSGTRSTPPAFFEDTGADRSRLRLGQTREGCLDSRAAGEALDGLEGHVGELEDGHPQPPTRAVIDSPAPQRMAHDVPGDPEQPCHRRVYPRTTSS